MKNSEYFNSFKTFRTGVESVEQNFDISVVMPFYKKLEAFKKVLPKNKKYFERNGIEVIIVLDCPDEKVELIEYIKEYPFINWKVLSNDKPHEWRNPTKPINVGIKHATKRYVMVCSPESEFCTDAIFQLRELLEYYPKHYALGTVCFAEYNDIVTDKELAYVSFMPYGSIMVETKHLKEIKGYDESLNKWGGDDDNIRARLELHGIKQLRVPDVKLIHREKNKVKGNSRRTPPLEIIKYLHYPDKVIVNETWGDDFENIIYDWQNNKYAEEQLCNYLSHFVDYSLIPESTKKSYKSILLLPTYNEEKRIRAFFELNAWYFDGIIMLDDESTDATYEMAIHDKLILKVKKKRNGFNDLENRNILLNLVSFFKCNWICFIDADEIVDKRYSRFNDFFNKKHIDSIFINMVHLWNDDQSFNTQYPSTVNGIGLKSRIFKNIGRSQILSRKGKLHFEPVPYRGNIYHAPILINHYGHIDAVERRQKYEFYKKEDIEKCQKSYEHLISENIVKRPVNDISIEHLQYAISIINKKDNHEDPLISTYQKADG